MPDGVRVGANQYSPTCARPSSRIFAGMVWANIDSPLQTHCYLYLIVCQTRTIVLVEHSAQGFGFEYGDFAAFHFDNFFVAEVGEGAYDGFFCRADHAG